MWISFLSLQRINLQFELLSGNQWVGDITKQFLYALTYKEFAEIIQARNYNHFEMGKLYKVDVIDYSKVDYEPIIEEIIS